MFPKQISATGTWTIFGKLLTQLIIRVYMDVSRIVCRAVCRNSNCYSDVIDFLTFWKLTQCRNVSVT